MQSDQSLCLSLEYSMSVKLLTEHLLEVLSLKGGCTGSSESTLVKMSNCWKSHATAHMYCRRRKIKTDLVLQEDLDHQNVHDVHQTRSQDVRRMKDRDSEARGGEILEVGVVEEDESFKDLVNIVIISGVLRMYCAEVVNIFGSLKPNLFAELS